ncbi:hypothetical protein ACKAV7_005904 [Fusarium commune]
MTTEPVAHELVASHNSIQLFFGEAIPLSIILFVQSTTPSRFPSLSFLSTIRRHRQLFVILHKQVNTDEGDIDDEDDEGFDEDNIVAYQNILHDCIIAKHVAPHIGYIPGIKSGNTLFEHQRHTVGAAMQSPAGPFKGMILRDPPGLGKTLVALAVAALSWKLGDVPSLIVAPLSCCREWMAEIDAFFDGPGVRAMEADRKYMILDEAHVIKDRNTRTFAVVTAPREQLEGFLALTGTPLDNTCEDGYALLGLLKGHSITSFKIFQKILKGGWGETPQHPHGEVNDPSHLDARCSQLLETNIPYHIPPRTGIVRHFALDSEDRQKSNLAFMEYKQLISSRRRNKKSRSKKARGKAPRRNKTMLQVGHGSCIIVDESEWFLDIVAITLRKRYHLVGHDTYSGRRDTVQRHLVIKMVSQATLPHALLASRGTDGQGLNFQFENVVIRCGPWWKKSWEEQAAGRVHRPGQQKPTFIYELRAQDSAVENKWQIRTEGLGEP